MRDSILKQGSSWSCCTMADGRVQLVQHQLDPELRGLVLDDEQHLVVVRRLAHGLLGGEQRVEAQITRIGLPALEVRLDALFQLAFVAAHVPMHLIAVLITAILADSA